MTAILVSISDVKLRVAAGLLGYNVKTLRRWIANGKLRAFRSPGGQLTISSAEIERFRATRRTCQSAEVESRVM